MDLTEDFPYEIFRKILIKEQIGFQLKLFNDFVLVTKKGGILSKDQEKKIFSDFEKYIEQLYEISEKFGMEFNINHVQEALPKNMWTQIYDFLRANNFFGKYTLVSKEQEVETYEKMIAAEKNGLSLN